MSWRAVGIGNVNAAGIPTSTIAFLRFKRVLLRRWMSLRPFKTLINFLLALQQPKVCLRKFIFIWRNMFFTYNYKLHPQHINTYLDLPKKMLRFYTEPD
jgi:hypothetical protein